MIDTTISAFEFVLGFVGGFVGVAIFWVIAWIRENNNRRY